ncbi:hypothetical protein ABFS83_10G071400 [Erythranthe nasuta]
MRAGACAAQQTLSAEAASVLKHSLSLSRRRGHAQVTPLHVAATLLSSRASLLRRACLKSQPHHHQPSHPLQCRALELCFNVALNRLPATPAPLLHAQPSLSNALVAALKRAQAHQRRGCVEQQHHHQNQNQPPLVTIKVELEQLILSILDDPSVSRVMREAGFSSTAVKNNLEDSNSSVFQCYNTSGGIFSTPNSPPPETHRENPTAFHHYSHLLSYAAAAAAAADKNPFLFSSAAAATTSSSSSLKQDIKTVLDVLLRKNSRRKNTVIVGDSLSTAEALVSELTAMVDKGEVPDELKSAHFIKFQFSSVPLRFMKREEVEINIADLKRKVDSFSPGGVFIYTGDLKWTVDYGGEREDGGGGYSPVDHLVAEMGKLLSWYNNSNNSTRVWLLGTANYQTYIKCQMKHPPLDLHWNLQPVSVPSSSGGLGLSLNAAATSGLDSRIEFPDKKSFCVKEEEHDVLLTCCPECTSSYEREAGFKKCFSSNSIDKDAENGSSRLPFWLKKPHPVDTLDKENLVELRRKYNKLCKSLHRGSNSPNKYNYNYPYWPNTNSVYTDHSETISFAHPTASLLPRFRRQQSCHINFTFADETAKSQTVIEPNLDSLKGVDEKEVKITLALGNSAYSCAPAGDVFQENVPWQSKTIPLILEALVDSKGMNRDKFVLIEGNDFVGKRRFAVMVAESVFGSSDLLLCMSARKGLKNKREIIDKALKNHENLVVLVEDADFADCEFAEFLDERYENRKSETEKRSDKEDTGGHAIFVLTTDGESNKEVDNVIQMKLVINESKHSPDDNPIVESKRRAKMWDLPITSNKRQRSNEMEDVKKSLDLNIEADEDNGTIVQQRDSPTHLLEKIKNRFVMNRDSDQEVRAREMFLSKLEQSFKDVSVSGNFEVGERVLEEILRGSGFYLNSMFDRWAKEVFETSLLTLDNGGDRTIERVVSIRLCLGEKCEEDGYMGTCLPKSISVSL